MHGGECPKCRSYNATRIADDTIIKQEEESNIYNLSQSNGN